jgi:hypothetical protein
MADGELLDEVLLARLMALAIGPPDAALSFTDRLARDNGWSLRRSRRVLIEYRRFLYLAATAPEDAPVTPSDAVDQAWHLHLAYTRDYWQTLCRDLLGQPLHHGPTAGGAAEGARYHRQYEATLARYAQLFGPPPRDIWPDAADRFSAQSRWVDMRRNIVLPRLPVMLGGAAVGAALLASCSRSGHEEAQQAWVIGIGVIVGLVLIALGISRLLAASSGAGGNKKKGDGGGDGGCGGQSDGGGSGCGSGCGSS